MSGSGDADGWQELRLSLRFEQPSGALLARLTIDEPDGRLVEIELSGDEVARLLAGEVLAVTGQVGGAGGGERLDEDLAAVVLDIEGRDLDGLDADEPDDEPEAAAGPDLAAVEQPEPAAPTVYSTSVDEPPVGTEPIVRSTDLGPTEQVVAYLGGRWRDAVVVSRDIGSVLVAYSRSGRWGQGMRQRVRTEQVRRWT